MMAMTVLLAAIPVHHAHVLFAALDRPVFDVTQNDHARNRDGSQASERPRYRNGSPGRAEIVESRATHHDAALATAEAALPEDGPSLQEMPRCPVCSTVKSAGVPVPPRGPVLIHAWWRQIVRAPAAAVAFPSALRFRTIQPRAPPTSG